MMATPKPPILNQSTSLMCLESRFLNLAEMSRQAQVCKPFNEAFKHLLTQAKLAEPLLDHVLNIDEARKKNILEIIKTNPEFILYRTKGSVKYFSSKQNKIAIRITMDNVSPLEAAALSGDFHLVNIFRDAFPETLKRVAGLQLSEILSRSDFLEAFSILKKSYIKYITEYAQLDNANQQDMISLLWEQVGEAQKILSTFNLQVFCNSFPHEPSIDFTKEPARSCKVEIPTGMFSGSEIVDLDFDSIGLGTQHALWKGVCTKAWCGHGMWFYGTSGRPWFEANEDLGAMQLLYEVILKQLNDTKICLLGYTPDHCKKEKSEQRTLSSHLTTPASTMSSDSDMSLEVNLYEVDDLNSFEVNFHENDTVTTLSFNYNQIKNTQAGNQNENSKDANLDVKFRN